LTSAVSSRGARGILAGSETMTADSSRSTAIAIQAALFDFIGGGAAGQFLASGSVILKVVPAAPVERSSMFP